MPAVILEAAHITNPDEEKRIVDEAFQRGFAQALVTALRRFVEAERSASAASA